MLVQKWIEYPLSIYSHKYKHYYHILPLFDIFLEEKNLDTNAYFYKKLNFSYLFKFYKTYFLFLLHEQTGKFLGKK